MDNYTSHKQTRPDDFFFRKPSTPEPDTPTVGPLRISKASTASPASRSSSTDAILDGNGFAPPPRSVVSPPYPDDRPNPLNTHPGNAVAGAHQSSRTSTPEEGRKSTPTGRARFSANDPNRPTISGYSTSPGPKSPPPASLRPAPGRVGTPARRLPEPASPEALETDDGFARPAVPTETSQAPLTQATYQQYYPPPSSLEPKASSSINRISSIASTSTTRAERGSPPPETPILGRSGGPDVHYPAPSMSASLAGQNAAAAQRMTPYAAQMGRFGTSSPSQQLQPQQETRRPWTPTEQPGSNPYGPPTVYQGVGEVPADNSQPATSATSESNQAQAPASYQAPSPQNAAYQLPHTTYGVPVTAQQAPAASAYQTSSQPSRQATQPAQTARFSFMPQSTALEQNLNRLSVGEEPPPAYTSVSQQAQGGPTTAQGYPYEKRSSVGNGVIAAPVAVSTPSSAQDPNLRRHPAFANDSMTPTQTISPTHPAAAGLAPIQIHAASTPSPGPATAGPASPPPLPEGWIAHIDPNSGQYYYIHLPTQSTQWEFPKGPTPLTMQEPMSPASTYAAPLASPAYSNYRAPSIMSPSYPPHTPFSPTMSTMGGLASPTVTGFTGPPPSAGVDLYKVQPSNGVYFGPYLRYTNMDLELGLWLGSILLVTDAAQPPTIHIHQSVDLSPNPRQLKANAIFTHQRWVFYRYDIDLRMEDQANKWTYAITSHLGCTRYEFLVAARYDTSWRFIAHSGNDFALNASANERSKLGGVGPMWKDILQKHVECGGFHAQLGLGGQIYGDRLWKEIPALKQWTAMSGKENRKNAPWTATHEDDVMHAYFHYYTSHFDQPHLREAFAQIPHILTLDDNDM